MIFFFLVFLLKQNNSELILILGKEELVKTRNIFLKKLQNKKKQSILPLLKKIQN